MSAARSTRRFRGLLALILVSSGLAGCRASSGVPEDVPEVEVESVLDGGVPNGTRFALYAAENTAHARERAEVLFVDADGRLTKLPLPEGGPGEVVSSDGVVCVVAGGQLIRLTAKAGEVVESPETRGSESHWAGVDASGNCVGVYNSGGRPEGYTTHAVWSGSEASQAAVMAVPDAGGVGANHVWVVDIGPDGPGYRKLYRVDRATGASEVFAKWPLLRSSLLPEPGVRGGWAVSTTVVEHDGKLFFLEEYGDDGWQRKAPPGSGSQMGLASVDLATGEYQVLPAQPYVEHWIGDADGVGGDLPLALMNTHLHEGHLFAGAPDGRLLAIDVKTGRVQERGRFSREAQTMEPAGVTWQDDRLFLLLFERGAPGLVEEYDLTSGERVDTWEVPGLGDLHADWDVFGLGVLPRAGEALD